MITWKMQFLSIYNGWNLKHFPEALSPIPQRDGGILQYPLWQYVYFSIYQTQQLLSKIDPEVPPLSSVLGPN